jgi:hypothetical protein
MTINSTGTVNATNLTRGGSQVYSRNNILGTVSQSGGVPTAAVIQRGSNANGEFVRYADGTQIVHREVNITVGSGATVGWSASYPVNFVSTANMGGSVQLVIGNSTEIFIGTEGFTTSGLSGFARSTTGNSRSGQVRLILVGRWF